MSSQFDRDGFFRNPDATGLLVIDMQNDFVSPSAPLATPNGLTIVPTIASLARQCRLANMPIIYSMEMHRPGLEDFGIEGFFEVPHCLEGTEGCEIVEGLQPADGDHVVTSKRRYDAFLGTELDLLLRCLGVENLLITGVCTDICVTSTVQHARNLDYRCFVVSDAVDGTSAERHSAALLNLPHVWAYVGDSQEASNVFGLQAEMEVSE